MPIKNEIARNGRVILQTYSDPLDMIELRNNVKKLQAEFLDHAEKPIHTITDATSVTRLPTNLLSSGLDSVRQVHPMGGQIVIVTRNSFIQVMSDLFKRLARGYTVVVVSTLDEAWRYIDNLLAKEIADTVRPTLPENMVK